MNNDEFMSVALNVLRDYQNPGSCLDQCVGEVSVGRNQVTNPGDNFDGSDFAKRQDIPTWRRPDGPTVILILESPHTDEFVGSKGPAKGETGVNIRKLFGEACNLRPHLLDGSYPLVLLNAIQYQCSLGLPTKYFRDRVFADTWNQIGKSDFQSRIQALRREGDVLINACTAGKYKPKNRELVEDALKEINLASCIKVEHPGNWARRRNSAHKHKQCLDYGWKS